MYSVNSLKIIYLTGFKVYTVNNWFWFYGKVFLTVKTVKSIKITVSGIFSFTICQRNNGYSVQYKVLTHFFVVNCFSYEINFVENLDCKYVCLHSHMFENGSF